MKSDPHKNLSKQSQARTDVIISTKDLKNGGEESSYSSSHSRLPVRILTGRNKPVCKNTVAYFLCGNCTLLVTDTCLQ